MKPRATKWQRSATALAAALGLERLHPEALAWASGRSRRESWGVAFSGGADSLALLLLLWAHWPERRERMVALHFDHRLRGHESRGDAAFCRRVCRGLGVPLVAERWARPPKNPSEATARAARMDFFQRALRGRRTAALWLGQQQDDIAESLLMRLARGSGTAGLAAPRPVHVRPLLTLKKAELKAALAGAGIGWREDSSNAGGDFFRNRIRRDVLPAWTEAAGRDALAGAALSRELLAEDDAALESWLDGLRLLAADGTINLGKTAGLPRALLRRALHRWLGAQGRPVDLSKRGFDRLLAAVEAGADTRHSLGTDTFAVIRRGRLSVQRKTRGLASKRTGVFPRSAN